MESRGGSDKEKKLADQLLFLKREVQDRETERNELRVALEAKENDVNALERQVFKLQQYVDIEKSENARLISKVREHEGHVEEMKNTMDAVRKEKMLLMSHIESKEEEIKKLNEEVHSATVLEHEEVERVKRLKEEVNAQIADKLRLQNEVEAYKREIESLREQLEYAKDKMG
uniref:Uncharacterized protein n=1 Tax=Palpitomonas bilix TaxID=652834 RepID=A0A7S3D4E6_9EUKA